MNRSILSILMIIGWLMLLTVPALAQTHPFAIQKKMPDLKLIPDLFEWGPTSVSYSQSWSGNQSFSQGYLLKDMRARLANNLDFEARMGFSFTPGAGLDGSANNSELVIPFAAINWQPSDHFLMRVEYSQGSYHPSQGFMGMDGFYDPISRSVHGTRGGFGSRNHQPDTD